MTRRIILALLFITTTAFAQPPEQFLGYHAGERFTPCPRIVDYFNTLAKSSNLITVEQFGETYEHRPLLLAIVTSPANRAKLDQIPANVVSLANGTVSADRAGDVAKNTPAIAWLAFGIHGNESSSAEAATGGGSAL